MSTFSPMEVHTGMKIGSVCEDHEKFFFILHQGTLDKSFLWNDDKIIIKHYPDKPQPITDNRFRSLINHTKIFLFLYDGLKKILSDSLNNKFYISGDYEVIKTNYLTNFSIDYEDVIVYLPQTNQAIKHKAAEINRDIFITHAFIVIIPISRYSV